MVQHHLEHQAIDDPFDRLQRVGLRPADPGDSFQSREAARPGSPQFHHGNHGLECKHPWPGNLLFGLFGILLRGAGGLQFLAAPGAGGVGIGHHGDHPGGCGVHGRVECLGPPLGDRQVVGIVPGDQLAKLPNAVAKLLGNLLAILFGMAEKHPHFRGGTRLLLSRLQRPSRHLQHTASQHADLLLGGQVGQPQRIVVLIDGGQVVEAVVEDGRQKFDSRLGLVVGGRRCRRVAVRGGGLAAGHFGLQFQQGFAPRGIEHHLVTCQQNHNVQ